MSLATRHLSLERLGYRLSGFREYSFEDAVRILAEIGYKAVELCLEHPDLDNNNPKRLKNADIIGCLKEKGMTVSAVSFHTKTAGWEVKTEKCRYGIRLASEIGTKIFIAGPPGENIEGGFGRMVEFTEEMCRLAEKYGVDFAIEPEPGTVVSNSDDLKRLIASINSARLKINLDIGHSFITQPDIIDDIKGWGKLIVHTHIEDIKNKTHKHLIPGEGDLNFAGVFDAFEKIGYDGYYVLDLAGNNDNPADTAKRAFNGIKRFIREEL